MPRWRLAGPDDDQAIVSMSVALYSEGTPHERVTPEQVHTTLKTFRREPVRGRAIVLEDDDHKACGYAFLVSFWSNELGGEICTIDELFVVPDRRSQGCASELIESLRSRDVLWPGQPVALELEVSPHNPRARALYERLGFREKRNMTLRKVG